MHRSSFKPISMLAAGLVFAVLSVIALPLAAGTASASTPTSLKDGTASIKVLTPVAGQVITGPTLDLHVRARGYRIDARYAGTPVRARIGHYHEIIDGHLIDMPPFIDGAHDTIPMVGLVPGPHVLTIVPTTNDHMELTDKAVNVPFTYAGPYLPEPAGYTGAGTPSIALTAPADGSTVRGESFSLGADISNFVLCGECFGKPNVAGEGHWHIFLDQAVMSHMLTMAGDTTQTVSLKAISPGWHTFIAVLVGNDHMPIMPMTMSSVHLLVKR
jgi:hypothetical protein